MATSGTTAFDMEFTEIAEEACGPRNAFWVRPTYC